MPAVRQRRIEAELPGEDSELSIRHGLLLCLLSILRSLPHPSSSILSIEAISLSNTVPSNVCDKRKSREPSNWGGNDGEDCCGERGKNADVEKKEKHERKGQRIKNGEGPCKPGDGVWSYP